MFAVVKELMEILTCVFSSFWQDHRKFKKKKKKSKPWPKELLVSTQQDAAKWDQANIWELLH